MPGAGKKVGGNGTGIETYDADQFAVIGEYDRLGKQIFREPFRDHHRFREFFVKRVELDRNGCRVDVFFQCVVCKTLDSWIHGKPPVDWR